jgi:hypothetical protein
LPACISAAKPSSVAISGAAPRSAGGKDRAGRCAGAAGCLAGGDRATSRGVARQHLTGEEDLVAAPRDRLADQLLGGTVAVHLGGVDQAYAKVERPKGRKKKVFFPQRLEGGIVADLDSFKGRSERLRILRIRPCHAAMDRAGELIEDDDQSEAGSWHLRPVVPFASCSSLEQSVGTAR